MQFKTIDLILGSSVDEAEACLSAFLVYEDIATGKRAKEMCDLLAGRLGPDWKIDIQMSSFKSLCVEQMQRMAAAAATKANLLIISCYHAYLPAEVSEWMEVFLRPPDRPTAFVALLAGAPDRTEPPRAVEKSLARVAQRRGMSFFSHYYGPAAEKAANQLRPDRQ